MTERPACWTDGEAISDCRGCSRLIMAQILGFAPGRMNLVTLLPRD